MTADRGLRYGSSPEQTVALTISPRPRGTVALLHGGFWRDRHGAGLMDALAADLARRGWVAANVEYRRLGRLAVGYPDLLRDVADALDALSDLPRPLVTVGHSAGGQLSLWAASRPGLPPDAPGARPRARVTHAVAQAGVVDLVAAAAGGLGDGAVAALLGGRPDERPHRYALASPRARLPLGLPQLLVHGRRDTSVPYGLSEEYVDAAAAAGDRATLALLDDVGHFEHLDPRTPAWLAVVDWLEREAVA